MSGRPCAWVTLGGASMALIVFGAFGACGGQTEATPPADAGADQVVDSTPPPDKTTAPDVQDAAPICQNDADLNTILIPDAAIGDAGSGSTGRCMACSRANCAQELSACNGECACREVVTAAFSCLTTSQSPIGCLTPLANTTSQQAQPLGICTFLQNCREECGVDAFIDAGGDGSVADATGGG